MHYVRFVATRADRLTSDRAWPGRAHGQTHRGREKGRRAGLAHASVEDITRLFASFTKRYPFIKTEYFNAGSARLYNRILKMKTTVGKIFFDLVAVRGVETQQLIGSGFLQPYMSPNHRLPGRLQGHQGILGRFVRRL